MARLQLLVVMLVCIGVLVAAFLALILWRLSCCKKRKEIGNEAMPRKVTIRNDQTLETGIAKLHLQQEGQGLNHHHQLDHVASKKTGNNYYMYRRGVSGKSSPLFSWSDHPSSVTDAVENGWSRFAFATTYMSSPSTRSRRLLGLCAVGEHRVRETEPETSWEVSQGSADFMQKIRLNSGLKKVLNLGNTSTAAASVIRTALPLPGPPLGNNSFPQEAYFEITILFSLGDQVNSEGEKTKLIQENFNEMPSSESLVHVAQRNKRVEELKLNVIDDHHHHHGKDEAVLLSLGLTTGGSLPMKLPGSYPGSIGFGSNGSVHLDGIKLAFESEKAAWGRTDHVIGCGFDPRQKKVYFTVESELVHVVHCKSEEFGTPLYPTLAANTDIMVLVNFGQSAFKYAPANSQRTPNPCFVGPLVNASSHAFYEDSKELFSMGRIDSQWLNRSTTRGGSQYPGTANRALDFDEESNDLFEIVLDNCGRSPNTVL